MSCTRVVEICNQKGLHARASAAFSRTAQEFTSNIQVSRAGMEADGKSIIELLSLGA
ncbi:MAG TPA: HPr family phosphocarrier protein, partial [Hyphomonadaceae bacterium]|nr:HPr family phosphocarrier protein [Hyphomonadaceae bacterium]